MFNKNTKKGAFLSSLVALILCCSMFIGTTFAWFIDSVESYNNIITAGNLDVELYYQNDETSDWTKVDASTNIFKDSLWEPGHTEVIYLKLVNEGTLALKYQLGINIESEIGGTNVDGEPFKLSDYICMGVAEGVTAYTSREEAITSAQSGYNGIISTGYSKNGEMKAEAEEIYLAVVVYMPETVGNEANYKTGTTAPEINLGINLFATQLQAESDSFGSDYDKDAVWTGGEETDWYYSVVEENPTETKFTLNTAEDLAGLAEIVNSGVDTFEGKVVTLAADVDLNNVNWTPIGNSTSKFQGKFVGNGHTISNLYISGGSGLGLFGYTHTGTHIEGVTINGAYVSGSDYVGAVLGSGYLSANCIKDCTVTGATIIATPYFDIDKGVYDGGAKAGVIAGYARNGNISGCKAINCTVTAYRDLGGIAGMVSGEDRTVTVSGNTVENVMLTYIGAAGAYDENKTNGNMGDIVGRQNNATVSDNYGEATKNEDAVTIFTLDELIGFANAVNAGDTYAGKNVILGADIDLNGMEWTPIGNKENPFKGTFDGNGHTISNLVITGSNSNAGLFGFTTDGEIKNLTVKNASVSGRLNVGVVAGTPYDSKYTNITVTGHVEVNGFSYVGGVGGKNAYADWNNIAVNVDETSYVKAISTEYAPDSEYADENGYVGYRSYVGGVIGFNGEGSHTFKNITSNIDVIGDVCDIGGVFGIAHYGNSFENITCTGNVSCTGEADEIGGIAGVWHNQNNTTVTMTNVSFNGNVSDATGTVSGCDIVGGAYSSTGTGRLIIDNAVAITSAALLQDALNSATGTSIIALGANITGDVTATEKDGVNITIEGNGYTYAGTITVNGNSARNTGSLTIQNVNFNAESLGADAYINLGGNNDIRYTDNVTVKGCTFSGNGFVAVKSYTGGDMNLTVDGCTVNAGMHSLLQVTNVEEGLTVTDCEVYSKNGINLNNTPALTMSNCTFDVQGYAVRFGVNGSTLNGNFSIADSELTSANDDGDAVIIFRGTMSDSTLALINTTLNGNPAISGDAKVIYAKYNEEGAYVADTAEALADALELGGTVVLTGDVNINEVTTISEDVVINLNGHDLDASANESRPITVADGASLTINAEGAEIECGAYGLVNMTEGTLTINGGTFTQEEGNNGSFIRVSGDEETEINLNNVTYKAGTTDSGVIRTSGTNVVVNVVGGTYEAGMGFLLENGSITGANITATNTANMWPAVYADGDITVSGCTIKSACHAIAVGGGNTVTVENCNVQAADGKLAFQVFSSGGTINVVNCTYAGSYGTTGKINSGCPDAVIIIDGAEVYRKSAT